MSVGSLNTVWKITDAEDTHLPPPASQHSPNRSGLWCIWILLSGISSLLSQPVFWSLIIKDSKI